MAVMLALAGMLTSLLVVGASPTPAGAADVTTDTSFNTDCIGGIPGIEIPQSNFMGFSTTAPESVGTDDEFTMRIAPQQGNFPDIQTNPVLVTVLLLKDIKVMYDLPTNASVLGVSVVPGTAQGISGTPTVSIDTSFNPDRIVLNIPLVPKNKTGPNGETYFTFPAIDVNLKATGTDGQSISTRVAGTNRATAGYVFTSDALFAGSVQSASVQCWPAGSIPAPALSNTTISSSSSLPTTTELTVDPLELPAGNQATMTATVSTTIGVVRFNDGSTVLGYAEVGSDGKATLTTPLNTVGTRPIVASYLGSGGFEPSASPPVNVNVTDPANRTRVQLAVVPDPARSVDYGNGPTPVAVAVTATPTAGGVAPVTGAVSLYDNGTLVATTPFVDNAASFTVVPPNGGHELRAQYVGDVNYFAATGTSPLPSTLDAGDYSPTLDQPVTAGSIGLNGATGAIDPTAVLNSTFRTDSSGVQTLDGVLVFGPSTLAVSGGTVTGQLAQVGQADGQIAVGADAAASLNTSLIFQVTEADLGSGPVTFQSGCVVGPFDVNLSGTRTGVNGELELADSGFSVPFLSVGSCVTSAGTSLATPIGARFAGGNTNLSVTLTPPPAGIGINISGVTTSLPGSAAGQPVTLSATISRSDSESFDFDSPGNIHFYVGDEVVAKVPAGYSGGPTLTASVTLPGSLPALPVGTLQLKANFVPDNFYKTTFATSPFGASSTYVVSPAVVKAPVALTLAAPASVPAGQVATLDIELSPAPNTVPGPAPLTGTIKVYDDAATDPTVAVIPMNPGNNSGLVVAESSTGVFSTQIALAPGRHELRAEFTPDLNATWFWDSGSSPVVDHTVVGPKIPTSLTILSESTQGTHQVRDFNGALYVTVQVTPAIAATGGPLPGRVQFSLNGATPTRVAPDASGRATLALTNSGAAGPKVLAISYDPSFRLGANTLLTGNAGYAASSTTFEYEMLGTVVGPRTSKTRMTAITPSPVLAGSTWSGIESFVTFAAEGSVAYTARNIDTAVTTPLGSVAVARTTAANARGRAFLANPAASASLAAGTYEVTAVYTPTDPLVWTASTSDPYLIKVVAPGSPLTSVTSLTASPPSPSLPGQQLVLSASVGPSALGGGTVEFFDGATSLGSAPIIGTSAQRIVFSAATGSHSYTAVFTPTSTATVTGSTSSAVVHVVAPGAPDAPASVIAVAGGRQAAVDWEAPPLDGGSPITGYTVTASPGGQTVHTVAGVTLADVIGLEPGTAYTFTVTAENELGTSAGAESNEVTVLPATEFTDVPPAHVFFNEIMWLAQSGITTGYEDGSFQPSVAVARQAMAAFLYRFAGEPNGVDPQCSVAPFTDVPVSNPFCGEIEWLTDAGIATGYEDGSFKPSVAVARQAMAAFLYRFAGEPNGVDPQCSVAPFTDVPVSNPFCGEIEWLAGTGITTGYEDGSFKPSAAVARQAMAAFLYRFSLVAVPI